MTREEGLAVGYTEVSSKACSFLLDNGIIIVGGRFNPTGLGALWMIKFDNRIEVYLRQSYTYNFSSRFVYFTNEQMVRLLVDAELGFIDIDLISSILRSDTSHGTSTSKR